jgi:hypothetical protein
MEILRPNENLLLLTGWSVAELGAGELEKLGIRISGKSVYRCDGNGHVWRIEGDNVEDEEFGWFVDAKDYYVVDWKGELESDLGGVILTNIEHYPPFSKRTSFEGVKEGGKWKRRRRGRRGGFDWGKDQRYVCGVWKRGECVICGYKYWVRVPCRREWCPECGKEGSLYHRWVYYRLLPYALQMVGMAGALGYLVVTCPKEHREAMKEPKVMSEFREEVSGICEEEGLWPAVYRWHFAGDKGRCWYPHLNVLFPMGYIEPEDLDRIKRKIERRIGVRVVYYEYTRELGKVMHIVRYVSRPTWNLQNEVGPERFKNFKKWGVWGKKKLVSVGEVLNRRESEEFWTLLSVHITLLLEEYERVKEATEPRERVDELMKKIIGLVEKMEESSGVGMEGLVNEVLNEEASDKEALVDSERVLKKLVRRLWARIADVKGYPMLEEIAGFVVLHGRCIGCFGKIKWKWRKPPFVALGERVYKVGWGCWIVSDKEDDEEFPF